MILFCIIFKIIVILSGGIVININCTSENLNLLQNIFANCAFPIEIIISNNENIDVRETSKLNSKDYFIIFEPSKNNKSIIIFDFHNKYSQNFLNDLAVKVSPNIRVNLISHIGFDESIKNHLVELKDAIIYLAGAKNITAQKIIIEV